MERLTEKRDGQNVIPLRQDGKSTWALSSAGMGDAPTQFLYGVHADKLAEYEDLQERLDKQFNGCLEMETVIDAMIEYDKQIDKDKELAAAMMITNESVHKYREWKRLDGQGRLLKPPCKVGDTVYEINKIRGAISEFKVKAIKFSEYGFFIEWNLVSGIYNNLSGFNADDIGKFVFFTREEAEAALKRMDEDA